MRFTEHMVGQRVAIVRLVEQGDAALSFYRLSLAA